MTCKICGGKKRFFDKGKILKKYDIDYFRCEECGAVTTEEPYWLDEAYSSAISESDIGLISRNMYFQEIVSALLKSVFCKKDLLCIDYGAGLGMFVRMMRDNGFNFRYYDKYCENMFAKGFEAEKILHDFLVAFEVFEHLPDPTEELTNMLSLSKNIMFSTELISETCPPKVGEWWYYSLEYGQHICFYTMKSIKAISEKFNLNLYSNGFNLHLLTENKISPMKFKWLTRLSVAKIYNMFNRRESFLMKDYFNLMKSTQNFKSI